MYHANTSGSDASNITLYKPRALMIFAGTSVRHVFTFSVIPSDSTMTIYAPASINRLGKQDGPLRITCAFGPKLVRSRRAAGSKLNAYFRFGFQSGLLNRLHQAQPV